MAAITAAYEYAHLHIIPRIIAENVATEPYTGNEISRGVSAAMVKQTEKLRQKLTYAQVKQFIEEADARCEAAYKKKAAWFMKIARSKSNQGRDTLYAFMAHWLAAFVEKGTLNRGNSAADRAEAKAPT